MTDNVADAPAWRGRYQRALQRERDALLSLQEALSPLSDVQPEDLQRLRDAVMHLNGLFYLVVLGEFNAGKSAFINGLLGERMLPEGITPTTSKLHLITYGPERGSRVLDDERVEWTHPTDWLRHTYLVDTPGSNSLFREHEELARKLVHRADAVFFVMAANRAFAETDRLFLELVRESGPRAVLILNQTDLLTGDDEVERVYKYVRGSFNQLTGLDAQIYPVSARIAMRAAESESDNMQRALWEASGFQPVCDLIRDILTERERARGTLLTAIRSGIWLVERYNPLLGERLSDWLQDEDILANIDGQFTVYVNKMQDNRLASLDEIDQALDEIGVRANAKLAGLGGAVIRLPSWLPRLGNLIRRRAERTGPDDTGYDAYLYAGAPARIAGVVEGHHQRLRSEGERVLASSIDHVNRRLAEARPEVRERLVGEVRLSEQSTRDLVDIGDARELVEASFDSVDIPESVQSWQATALRALWHTLLWEIGVVVLAWLASIYVQSFIHEPTPIYGWIVGIAVALVVLGLFLLPWRRWRVRRRLREAMADLREVLLRDIAEKSEELLARHRQALNDALSPYRRLIESERGRLIAAQERMERVRADLDAIRVELDAEEPSAS